MTCTTQHYWRSSAIPFVELRSTFDSPHPYKPHFHPEFSFGALISGSSRASCGGSEFVLTEGDLVLIPPRAVHSCNPVERRPRSYHMLYVNEAWCLENLTWRSESASGSGFVRNAKLFADYLEFIVALPDLQEREASDKLQGLMRRAMECQVIPAPQMRNEPLAEQIKKALLDRIAIPTTLDDLAGEFGCRKETLIRVFRKAFHTTPHAFMNCARIEQAKLRLRRGDKIADVAADLGFSDQSQLHRTFIGYTASTPGQYRRGGVER